MLRRLAVVLAILLGTWLLLRVVRRTGADGSESLSLPALGPAAVDRLVLVRALDSLDMVRVGTQWTVNGNPASQDVIDAFLATASDTTFASELVARSAASFQRMGVDSATGHRITISGGGKPILDLWQGNRGPELDGFYFRRVGDNRVFLVRGQFAEMTGQPADAWRDRRLARIPAASIGAVQVERGRAVYTISRRAGGWMMSGGHAADTTKVARFLAMFGDLRASGFPDATDLPGILFDPAERIVTVTDTAGQTLLAVRLDSAVTGFWAQTRGSAAVYRLETRITELIAPPESTLRAK
ncbi:MAG: DUF4340 domain-containing protein [Gemmatimonadales bacterium]